MLSLFSPKKSSMLGIDIGSSSVRLLELAKQGDKIFVQAYAMEPLPENAVEGKNIKEAEAVAEAIKAAVQSSQTKTKHVALAVPDSSVITKVIQLEEGLSDDEAEELVILEADKYIPYPIDEVSIDHQILGPSSKGGTLLDVLVVASRSENVNARVDLMKECGLEVAIVDVESYAVERTSHYLSAENMIEGQDKTVAIFDIGDVYTQLTVLHDLKTAFSREEAFGGKQLTEELMKRYGLSAEDANLSKKRGTLPDDYLTEVLEPFKEMVGLQIRRALQFFYSTSQLTSVDSILLAGGTAQLPGLVQMVEEVMEVPTSLADPMSSMSFQKKVDVQALSRDTSGLMISCGLALRAFG